MRISKPFIRNNRTWATISELFPSDTQTFDVRVITAPHTTGEEDLLIASDVLESALRDPELDWNDEHEGFYHEPMFGLDGEQVERICRDAYDEIFFFTDDYSLRNLSDPVLLDEMKVENPDFFI